MASMNIVILIGNLTRNPEIRYTPGGKAVCDLGLAVNDSYKNKDGEIVEQTCFVDVVAWDKLAENVSAYLRKGSSVSVRGKLQLDTWESQDGEKRSRIRVRTDDIQFLDKKDA